MAEKLFPLVTKHFNITPKDENRPMEEEWVVSLKEDNQAQVGSLRFEDGLFNGEVKVAVELNTEYDKTMFVQEVYYSMARFVFRIKDVREICTECRHENDHRVRGLEKAGYVRRETKDGVDHYSMTKQKSSWTGLYIMIGLISGFIIGLTVSNLWMGTIGGVLTGAIIGYLLDKRDASNQI